MTMQLHLASWRGTATGHLGGSTPVRPALAALNRRYTPGSRAGLGLLAWGFLGACGAVEHSLVWGLARVGRYALFGWDSDGSRLRQQLQG